MASGSGTSFEQPYTTQHGVILPTPLPSSVGGNTYMYEEQTGGKRRFIHMFRKGGAKGKKIPKSVMKSKTKHKTLKTPHKTSKKTQKNKPAHNKTKNNPKTKITNKKQCQLCKLKLF